MHVERAEHVTLVGGNGSGKTTLIQTLTGRAELPEGKLSTGHNVHLGYVSQHAEGLSEDGSLLDATTRATGLTPGKARALLGMFLFSGDDAEKPVAGLSGGERQRFSLAVLVNSGANMLVLDEPTNHLDLESREALEDALASYEGALLLASHDRALLDAVGSRTVAVEDYTLRSYVGGWEEYLRVREERKVLGIEPPPLGGERRTGRAARLRPLGGAAEEVEQAFEGIVAVTFLGAVTLGRDQDRAVLGQPLTGEPSGAHPNLLGQPGGGKVEPQLDRGRDLVDVLPTRPRGAHEALLKRALVDRQPVGDPDHRPITRSAANSRA
jgi:energy-coupling factor transporter ATP-binding protein EcfA2